MTEKLDLNEIAQRAWRDSQQDGLLEIAIGLLLLVTGVFVKSTAFAVFYILALLFMHRAVEAVRKRITYPRIGYVELVAEEPAKLVRGILGYMLLAVLALAAALLLFGDITDFDLWLRWVPALVGVWFSGGFIYAASMSGAVRFYGFVILAVGLGLAISILNPGTYMENLSIYLVVTSLLMLLSGLVILVRFLRRYPLPPEETVDVSE